MHTHTWHAERHNKVPVQGQNGFLFAFASHFAGHMDLNARRGHDIEMHTKLPPVLPCAPCPAPALLWPLSYSCPCLAPSLTASLSGNPCPALGAFITITNKLQIWIRLWTVAQRAQCKLHWDKFSQARGEACKGCPDHKGPHLLRAPANENKRL